MRLSDAFLMSGVAVSLGLAAALVVTSMSTSTRTSEAVHRPQQATLATDDAGETHAVAESIAVARTRALAAFDDGDIAPLGAARRREGRKREAAFLAEFLTLQTEQGPEVFGRTVRDVLASTREPQCRKVAALRALHSAGVPGTDAVLAAAVEGQSEVSDGSSLSVPRAALRLLFERAASSEDARRVLARLSFVENPRVSADLRRSASAALCASIRAPQRDEAERLLRLETTAQQFDLALAALSRDTNFGAAKPSSAAARDE